MQKESLQGKPEPAWMQLRRILGREDHLAPRRILVDLIGSSNRDRAVLDTQFLVGNAKEEQLGRIDNQDSLDQAALFIDAGYFRSHAVLVAFRANGCRQKLTKKPRRPGRQLFIGHQVVPHRLGLESQMYPGGNQFLPRGTATEPRGEAREWQS